MKRILIILALAVVWCCVQAIIFLLIFVGVTHLLCIFAPRLGVYTSF